MSSIACMGGFCDKREKCALYRTDNRSTPVERACPKDEAVAYEPINFAQMLKRGFIESGALQPEESRF